jgi:PAS domain S-box-containing protein
MGRFMFRKKSHDLDYVKPNQLEDSFLDAAKQAHSLNKDDLPFVKAPRVNDIPIVSTAKQKHTNASNSRLASKWNIWNIIFWCSIFIALLASVAPIFFKLESFKMLVMGTVTASLIMAIIAHVLQTRALTQVNTKERAELETKLDILQNRTWELHESEERHRSLIEAFGDMIMHRSADGMVTYVNEAFMATFGDEHESFLNKPFKPDLLEEVKRSESNDSEIMWDVKIKTQKGERWFAWLDLSLRDDATGETTVRSMIRDITRQKKIELELRKTSQNSEAASHAKSRFLANVSHEMRTPLNGILGMSGLLADTPLTPEQQAYVDAVHDSGTALLTLIEDILDMTVVEAGKLELKTTSTKPTRLVEDVCELLSSRAHEKNISISSYVSASVPELIEVDAGRLRQVLINLIGNALKFTEKGGVHLSLETETSNNQKTRLKFKASDTGPGISLDDQHKIFEEFAQADNESTRKHGGAGLGLSISKRIIEEMGGKIDLVSEIGKGSTFEFTIDVAVNQAAQNSNLLQSKDVLILGSDYFETRSLKAYIEDHGATNSSLDTLPASFDTVLIDQTIDINSAEVLSLLNFCKKAQKKAIILLEAKARSQLDTCMAAGFDGYLIKPVRKHSLINLISGKEPARPDSREVSGSKSWSSNLVATTEPRRILIAEDNEINATLARAILEKAGHSVARAENGAEAVSLWQEHKGDDAFDLIFMDLQMPIMDGLDALQEIRIIEQDNQYKTLPVFILTADEKADTRDKAIKLGATGFLTKPLEPEKLLHAVENISNNNQTHQLLA